MDLSDVDWIKASRSVPNGDCVEIGHLDGGVAVRDSKNPSGPVLFFNPREWDAFLAGARGGEFDRPSSQ